ncbi:MAG: hypothetical protein OXM55_02240 [Bdellovibrionales bacterium]|nr:hypothetical protein [Bdellovibrionales bacterium]
MKKFIIMGLTIFAFSLVGCGKSDEEKCDEDDTKEWKDGQCVDKEGEMAYFIITNKLTAAVTLESGSKSLELAQNACGKVAEADFESLKVSVATAAVCDNADATNKCPAANNYEVAAGPNAGDPSKLNKVDKPDDDSACTELAGEEDPEYTVTNLLTTTAVKVSAEGWNDLTLAVSADGTVAGGCVKVKKSQYAKLKIQKIGAGITPFCDNSDAATDNQCEENNLEVKLDNNSEKLVVAASANTNCEGTLSPSN